VRQPSDERFERFGLPRPPSDPKTETASQRSSREARVKFEGGLLLGAMFGVLKSHLGVDATQRLFQGFCRPRPRGRRGVSNPENDARLLEIYDLQIERENNKKSAPRLIAEHLDRNEPGKYGASAEAIEKHIRRLVGEQTRKEADRVKFQEHMEEEMRKYESEAKSRDK
jgi:hypothetical protein